MSDARQTPQPHELFMSVWQARLFTIGRLTMGSADLVHWAKVWIDCCELAGRLNEMETAAAEAKANTPTSWPPRDGG